MNNSNQDDVKFSSVHSRSAGYAKMWKLSISKHTIKLTWKVMFLIINERIFIVFNWTPLFKEIIFPSVIYAKLNLSFQKTSHKMMFFVVSSLIYLTCFDQPVITAVPLLSCVHKQYWRETNGCINNKCVVMQFKTLWEALKPSTVNTFHLISHPSVLLH